MRIYSGRVEALGSILSYLENQKEKYVVMSDANIAINYDSTPCWLPIRPAARM